MREIEKGRMQRGEFRSAGLVRYTPNYVLYFVLFWLMHKFFFLSIVIDVFSPLFCSIEFLNFRCTVCHFSCRVSPEIIRRSAFLQLCRDTQKREPASSIKEPMEAGTKRMERRETSSPLPFPRVWEALWLVVELWCCVHNWDILSLASKDQTCRTIYKKGKKNSEKGKTQKKDQKNRENQ